jgi:hypothetical protein
MQQPLAIDRDAAMKLSKAARERVHDSLEEFFRQPDCRKGEWTKELRARGGILLSLLGAACGIRSEEMRGEQSGGDGFDVPRAYVMAASGDSNRAQEMTPDQFAEGVRRAMRECRRFPSYGLLRDLAHGRDVTGYPGGMLNGQDTPAKATVHPRWEEIAQRWERENRAAGLSVREVTTAERGLARVREFQKLMDETFTVGEWPAEEPRNG